VLSYLWITTSTLAPHDRSLYLARVPTQVISFAEALADAGDRSCPRAVLLGNGFSIDWNAGTFDYHSLFEEAVLDGLAADKADLFNTLGTYDFERVVEFLKTAANLADLYGARDAVLADNLRSDANVVRNGLADVIAARHPARPASITDAEAESARKFLGAFDTIFTINYDLLLFWVINRIDTKHQPPRADGFQWPTVDGPYNYLVFKRRVANDRGAVFWLHGGLHLFVDDEKLYKLSYSSTPLIPQIRENLVAGQYPLVVTEGSSEEKRARIERSSYLTYANNRFRDLNGCLFVHGMSLSDNDDHLREALSDKESAVELIYVSIHGNKFTSPNRKLVSRAEDIAEIRGANGGRNLEVRFYQSESARVWR